MLDMRGQRMVLVLCAVALVVMGLGFYVGHRHAPAPILITEPAAASSAATPASTAPIAVTPPAKPDPGSTVTAPPVQTLIYVHVAGAVKHPSLYQIAPTSRVMHAIKAAGGPTAKADLDALNLAEKVHDGEKIYVPTKAAATAAPLPTVSAPSESVETSAPIAAHLPTHAAVRPHPGTAGSASPAKLVTASQGQVNLNTAGADQLQELPGIGPAMAGRILAYRQQAGSFQKVEDLMNVSGIGPKKFARIAPLVRLH